MKRSHYLISGLIAFALFFAGLLSGRTNRTKETVRFRTDTLTIVRIDTIRIEKPVPVRVVEHRTDTITVRHKEDTVFVPVPIRAYHFRGDDYRLDATGYNVEIQKLEVYPKTVTRYISNETVRTIRRKNRFGIGISAGYGFSKEGFSPYAGIGIQYNIVTF